MDDSLKQEIYNIIDSDLIESDTSEYSSNELCNIQDSDIDYTSESESNEDTCACKTSIDPYVANLNMNGLSINVLSSSEQFVLDMIEKISDNSLKREMIEQYLSKIKEPQEKPYKKPQIYTPYTLQEVISRFNQPEKPITIQDLKEELNSQKKEISNLKQRVNHLESICEQNTSSKEDGESSNQFLCRLQQITYQKWYINITLIINKTFTLNTIALVDSGADINCIREGLVPTQYYEKTKQDLSTANGSKLWIKYKLTDVTICNQGMCLESAFIMVPDLSQSIILGTPFLNSIQPMTIDTSGIHTEINGIKISYEFISSPILKNLNEVPINNINLLKRSIENKQNHNILLKQEIINLTIEEKLKTKIIQEKIDQIHNNIQTDLCNNLPNAFWNRKKHMISLPYEESFTEDKIPTKARPSQMDKNMLEYCKQEITTLLEKGLITPSKSPWSCAAFYVNKNAEKERGTPRLVINYKPLNKALKWIRYPIPNKKDLLNRLSQARIFSKFDLKSGFWQIQIKPEDRYKTAFTVPFGQYEWTVMPFGLKNAPSEFQNIMNDIFIPYSHFCIVYIDDILIFSDNIDQHFKHLKIFIDIVKQNGLVLSPTKINLFQTKIRFLGHNIHQGTIIPIERSLIFADNFPDRITDKKMLQRFLGSLNYIADFY